MVSVIVNIFMCNVCVRWLVLTYLGAGHRVMRSFGMKLRGIGIALRCLSEEFNFSIQGRRFAFLPSCAGAYCLMPAGLWNELETHLFFRNVLPRIGHPVTFIDVGASVGEMAIDVAMFVGVEKVIAFEPEPRSAEAIRKSALLNTATNIDVINKAVGDYCGRISFLVDERSPTSAHVEGVGDPEIHSAGNVEIVTLDSLNLNTRSQVCMLIDVEGFEPSVMRGGARLIRAYRPLIIFEFNQTSKKHFSLDEIRSILGVGYIIYRLTQDGWLSADLQNTWNCVAVHNDSPWSNCCKTILTQDGE